MIRLNVNLTIYIEEKTLFLSAEKKERFYSLPFLEKLFSLSKFLPITVEFLANVKRTFLSKEKHIFRGVDKTSATDFSQHITANSQI